jgi:hypothetical protein
MQDEPSPVGKIPPTSKWRAWGDALAITLLGLLVAGVGCFYLLGNYLLREMAAERLNLFQAGGWWEVGFGIGMGILMGVLVPWQRARGITLADAGWGRRTTTLALVLAVLLGAAFLSGCYFGARQVLPGVDLIEFSSARMALAPLGVLLAAAEETMMRGYFMTTLQRARVATWLQVLASGACSASYHALQNPTLMGFVPSFVLFSLHAGLYVLGKRSLTPVVLTHSIYHVIGQPYLLMMALTAMKHH